MDTAKTEFLRLLNGISSEHIEEDIAGLKFLLRESLPMGLLEKSKNGIDIFTLMLNHELLSFQNTWMLIKKLEDIKRVDQAKKLKDFNRYLLLLKSVPNNIKKEKLVTYFKKTETAEQLEEKMDREKVVTLYGPLGAGKSQNAIWFGINHQQQSHKNSVVWYCNAKSKTSLVNSLQCLVDKMAQPSMPSLISESEGIDTAITILCDELKEKLCQRRVPSSYHLMILDDVADECSEMVKNIVKSFVSMEENNTKFIATTKNNFLLSEYCRLPVRGFTVKESMDFLTNQEGVSDERKKCQYKELAETMSNLPLGLYTARTYMKNMSIGPDSFLKLLKQENFPIMEQQLEHIDLQSIFAAIRFCIYKDFHKNAEQDVFEMFQMTQFLDTEDIPIILLEYVFKENVNYDTMLLSNFLVTEIRKRSFGVIEGEDDDRLLSLHGIFTRILDICTQPDEKRRLLKKLILGFALLMDKDVYCSTDLDRLKLLIPHARSTLKHIEELDLTSDYEVLVLTTFVYDLVGFGYNFGRCIMITREF